MGLIFSAGRLNACEVHGKSDNIIFTLSNKLFKNSNDNQVKIFIFLTSFLRFLLFSAHLFQFCSTMDARSLLAQIAASLRAVDEHHLPNGCSVLLHCKLLHLLFSLSRRNAQRMVC